MTSLYITNLHKNPPTRINYQVKAETNMNVQKIKRSEFVESLMKNAEGAEWTLDGTPEEIKDWLEHLLHNLMEETTIAQQNGNMPNIRVMANIGVLAIQYYNVTRRYWELLDPEENAMQH